MRVPWTARRSNQSILKEINPGLSATWRVENRMTFDSLLPSKFLPVLPIYRANEETGQETLEISFSGFQYTTLPSSEEKSLDGQETSCMLLMFSCI